MSVVTRPRVEAVPGLVVLGADVAEEALSFVAWLRERHTETVAVSWQAIIEPEIDTTLLHHLPPPTTASGAGADLVPRWREAHRPAQCYYRIGPGFVQVKDVRPTVSAARFILDEPPLVGAFLRCLRPCRLADLDATERAAADALVSEQLLLRLDEWVVTLPSRMRRWPVPGHFA